MHYFILNGKTRFFFCVIANKLIATWILNIRPIFFFRMGAVCSKPVILPPPYCDDGPMKGGDEGLIDDSFLQCLLATNFIIVKCLAKKKDLSQLVYVMYMMQAKIARKKKFASSKLESDIKIAVTRLYGLMPAIIASRETVQFGELVAQIQNTHGHLYSIL